MRKFIIFCLMTLMPTASFAAEGYAVPDTSKATVILDESQYVGDNTPATEVNIKTYKKPDGTMVRVYSVAGRIFRYDVDTNGALPYEYRLIDKEGNGVFDTKEPMVGEMQVQEKGLKYYIDLGAEPGKEYRYSYENVEKPSIREQKELLMGYPIYIPQWVLVRFKQP